MHSKTDEHEPKALDKIMTDWDPVIPLAGQKRAHPSERETMHTRRGREELRHDYKRLHGKVALASTDPKIWAENDLF